MLFTDLRLQNYRSYDDASFELSDGVNIVVGPNAAGKTNLLEALMVSAVGKSYRGRDNLLIKSGKDWARIDAHTSDNISRTVKLKYDSSNKPQKTFEFDDKAYARLSHNQKYPVVLFEPDSLQLLNSEPVHRREHFDDLIEQYSPDYEQARNKYRRTLAQRNALLKQGHASASSQLFAWNLRISELAGSIVTARLELLHKINQNVAEIYSAISKHKTLVGIKYQSNIDTGNYSTNLLKKLELSAELDMQRGFTGSGPHREDFTIYFGDRPAVESASRGEVRTILLALKIIESQLLEESKNTKPLILLDDVFSELDGVRRKALTNFLKDHQTMITTTDADLVVRHFTDKYNVLLISRP